MEHIKLESIADTSEFWNDPYFISQYVNSLITSSNKQDVVSVRICDYSQTPMVTFSKKNVNDKIVAHYTISLPKIKDFYSDISLKQKDIKLRKAFLKHEVAHIIFSEMSDYEKHKRPNNAQEHLLRNALEDVRIEYKFGQRFQGANDTFFEVQETFYKQAKSKIENSKSNLFMLALYFMYRSKKFEFIATPNVEIYEKLYQKYKNFLNISQNELHDLVLNIKKEFEDIIGKSSNENSDDNEEDSNLDNQKNKPQINDDSEDEDSEDEDSENNNSEQDSDDNSKIDSDSDEDNDSQQKSQLSSKNNDSDSDAEDSDDSDSDAKKNSNTNSNGSDSSNADDETEDFKDFSDSLADEMQSNSKKEEQALKDKYSDNTLESNGEDIDENNDINVFKLAKLSEQEKNDFLNIEIIDNFIKYNNSSMKIFSSEIIDISKYLSLTSKKLNFSVEKINKKKFAYANYEAIISKNRKNINNLVNYFKLKFQQKERLFNRHNKEDGLLHNESLFKMFSNDFDKKIFYTVEKAVTSKADVSFLLDFSGSMNGKKIKYLIQTLIVMNEIFSRLEIPFNVFSFSGGKTYSSWKYKNKNELLAIKNAFSKSKIFKEASFGENYISFGQNTNEEVISFSKEIVYALVSRNTTSSDRKTILKLLLKLVNERYSNTEIYKNFHSNIFGGSTPEIQAVIGIYNKLPKQNLFLINDGSPDNVHLLQKETEDVLSFIKKEKTYLQAGRLLLNLAEGETLRFNSEEELLFFKSQVLSAFDDITKEYSHEYRATVKPNAENVQIDSEFYKFKEVINKFKYKEFSKDDKIENASYSVELKYNKQNDYYTFKLHKKSDFSFDLAVNNYCIKKSNFDTTTTNINLLFNKTKIDNLADLIRWKIYESKTSYRFDSKIYFKNDNEYCYRSLFQKMRNEGWNVWGIGIECTDGISYIGKEYFSAIRDSLDLQQNLEKRIKSMA